jgi:flavin-dependent thymidylate synthase
MFTAEPSAASDGIQVHFLQGTPDPLGSIAAFSAMYTGKVIRCKRDVTDEERRYHLEEMKKTKLKAPLEAVNLHFMVEGVTRSFTHQMVRQRTAVYAQESLRFAVKEDAADAVALPPSLQDIEPYDGTGHISKEQEWLYDWDTAVEEVDRVYQRLVNSGMPAEDARGLLPHSITTRLNYATNLRNLQDHAGNRLCTQAQFEWRMYWVRLLESMRSYCTNIYHAAHDINHDPINCDNWQWVEIANLFRPVCYYTGQCEFKAEFDRHCSIRDRVEANHSVGRGSSEWGETWHDPKQEPGTYTGHEKGGVVFIGETINVIRPIHPAEWLMDHAAARKAD